MGLALKAQEPEGKKEENVQITSEEFAAKFRKFLEKIGLPDEQIEVVMWLPIDAILNAAKDKNTLATLNRLKASDDDRLLRSDRGEVELSEFVGRLMNIAQNRKRFIEVFGDPEMIVITDNMAA